MLGYWFVFQDIILCLLSGFLNRINLISLVFGLRVVNTDPICKFIFIKIKSFAGFTYRYFLFSDLRIQRSRTCLYMLYFRNYEPK